MLDRRTGAASVHRVRGSHVVRRKGASIERLRIREEAAHRGNGIAALTEVDEPHPMTEFVGEESAKVGSVQDLCGAEIPGWMIWSSRVEVRVVIDDPVVIEPGLHVAAGDGERPYGP